MDDMKKGLIKGLISSPKYIPTWYIYDDVGSGLGYICCTDNVGYYLSRSQEYVLKRYTKDIVSTAPYDFTLADIGCGSCSDTKYFLTELLKQQSHVKFFPIDISKDFLLKACEELANEYGEKLTINPITKDYEKGIEQLRDISGPKMIVWLNGLMNLAYEDQVEKLKKIASILTEKCYLILSVDITQDEETVMKAYHDAEGHEKRFFLNCVERLNREEGSSIDLGRFHYKTDFLRNTEPNSISYFLAYLQAKEAMDIKIPGLHMDLHFQKDECIYIADGSNSGTSCKYTREQVRYLIEKAGLRLINTWTGEQEHVLICKCKII